MSVYRPPNSPYYFCEFVLNGERFARSTKTQNKREAETFERLARAELKHEQEERGTVAVSLKIADVRDRYWTHKGQHHSGARNTERLNNQLADYFTNVGIIFMADIDDKVVRDLVAWRRGHKNRYGKLISPYTVNDTTEALRQLFAFVKGEKITFKTEPDWDQHWLKEPEERVRELIGDEGGRIDAAARDDYRDILEFAKLSGLRQHELILRWSEVDWEARQIVKLGKGDKRIVVRITDAIRAILWPLRGHDPEFVFTYEARRTSDKVIRGRRYTYQKGVRYPITQSGLSTVWRRTRKASGVKDFRFHDFRHDFGTKALRKHQNLKKVQKMLNHASINSTMRYAHVTDAEVAEAWDDFHESRAVQKGDIKSQTKSQTRELKRIS